MKIGQPTDKPVPPTVSPLTAPGATDVKASAASAAATARIAEEAGAELKLSSAAATLLSTGNSAEFDAAKVARIASAIEKGEFKINPEVIADKLIANAQELLTQAKS